MTGLLDPCTASHIIAHAHENENEVSQLPSKQHQHKLTPFQWIEVIIDNRSDNSEDVTHLTFNDPRNSMLVSPVLHTLLESRQVAFLKVGLSLQSILTTVLIYFFS
jgi:hypothetical protein